MERFDDLFMLPSNLSLFLETIVPFVIRLFTAGAAVYVPVRGTLC
jgi:hypothetical protein